MCTFGDVAVMRGVKNHARAAKVGAVRRDPSSGVGGHTRQTPRDLAAWRGAGDILRDTLLEEGVAADACPGAAALGAWADAASRALTEDPSLGAHVSGFRD